MAEASDTRVPATYSPRQAALTKVNVNAIIFRMLRPRNLHATHEPHDHQISWRPHGNPRAERRVYIVTA
jgi:hypothetical protein